MSNYTTQIQSLLHDPECLIVCNHSGGKDSQAMYNYLISIVPDLSRIVVVHAHLGEAEWPGVKEHIQNTTLDAHELNVVGAVWGRTRPEKQGTAKTFLGMVEDRGKWPSAKYRQCTSDLKRGPIRKFVNAQTNTKGYKKVLNCMGLRAQESSNRSKMKPFKRVEANTNSKREWFEWLPIHDWSTDRVFSYIEECGQKPHWAYSEGMSRLSCSFCIMASAKDLCTAAKLRPELLKKYAALERQIGHTFLQPKKGQEPVYLDDFVNSQTLTN